MDRIHPDIRAHLDGLAISQWQEVQLDHGAATFTIDERRQAFHLEGLTLATWSIWGYPDWQTAYADHLLVTGLLARLHRLHDGTFTSATSPIFQPCAYSNRRD